MFNRISQLGIVFDNIRNLSLGLTVCSLLSPVLGPGPFLAAIGIAMGCYYGYRIEKETHEFRTLGGRIVRGKNWDYLVF